MSPSHSTHDAPKRLLRFSSSVLGLYMPSARTSSFSGGSAQGAEGQKRLHMPHLERSPLLLQHLQQPQ